MKIYCPRCEKEIPLNESNITSIHATIETIRIDIYIEHTCNEYTGLLQPKSKPKEESIFDDEDTGSFELG